MALPDRIERWQPPRVLGIRYADLMELWKQLPPPSTDELAGELAGYDYLGHSEQSFLSSYARVEQAGGAWWLGKAFSSPSGEGYNRMLMPDGRIERRDRFRVSDGVSVIDGRPALVLEYRHFDNPAGSVDLIDDLRTIRPGLYLAIATADDNGQRTMPSPFVLAGPSDPWIGADDPRREVRQHG